MATSETACSWCQITSLKVITGLLNGAVPTAEKSNHNFNAPVLDLGSAIWLAERKDVSKFFENMSVRFLEFLKRNDHWKSLYEHNHLRVSHAIDSLRPLHSWKLADWFYAKVKAFADSSYELMSDARPHWDCKASVEHDRIAGAFVGLSMGDALCFKIKYKMGKRWCHMTFWGEVRVKMLIKILA